MGNIYQEALSHKGKWDILVGLDSIKVGNTTIRKGTIDKLNAPYAITRNTARNIIDQFGKSDGTITGIVDSTLKKRFGIDIGSAITSRNIADTIASIGGNIFKANPDFLSEYNISNGLGLKDGLGSAFGTGVSDFANGIGNGLGKASKRINNYIAPISNTIDRLNQIGKEFDDIIKETFLGQVFKLKGSEILCSIFCIVVSLLPCNARQKLYEAVKEAKNTTRVANSLTSGFGQLTASSSEAPLANERSIADNVRSLFSKTLGDKTDKVFNIPSGTGTKKPSITLEIPPSVISTISNLTMALSILAKGQITLPVGLNSSIWAQSQVILNVIQSIVAQMADEFLTKVVKKIEQQLRNMTPQICVGNIAGIFINKIMNVIKELKDFYIGQISELFGDAKSFKMKWKKYSWYNKDIQELLAMLNALGLVLKKFPDLALLCGIQPCTEPLPGSIQEDIRDAVRNNLAVKETNEPAGLLSIDNMPTGKTLEEVADIFKSKAGNDASVIASDDGFSVIMPQLYKDAPSQIRDMITSDEFRNALGSAYNIYASDDLPYVNIVYTYKLSCEGK